MPLVVVVATCGVIVAGVQRTGTASAAPAQAAGKRVPLRQRVGLARIIGELGQAAPTGRGVITGHVEGGPADAYMPRAGAKRYHGVEFLPRSGAGKLAGHADATALQMYGVKGLAPGVTEVHCFSAADWMGPGCLRTGTADPPTAGPVRVFNHSWIGKSGLENAARVLRRVDYLVDTQDALVIAGVNNGAHSRVPPLLAGAYNCIAVGVWSGKSSGGYTQTELPGRCKPDIVAPGGTTSSATPVVTALTARLLEVADQQGGNARRAEVIKAVLMAGAEKPPDWQRQPGKPLAEFYGAGRVRFDRSYHLLRQGPVEPGVATNRYGWAFAGVRPETTSTWRFDCLDEAGEVSIILTWHRRIVGQVVRDPLSDKDYWLDNARLADFDLKLVRIDDRGAAGVAAESVGRIDNVEHIYLKQLPPGRYRIEVSRKDALGEAWDFALAWRVEPPAAGSRFYE